MRQLSYGCTREVAKRESSGRVTRGDNRARLLESHVNHEPLASRVTLFIILTLFYRSLVSPNLYKAFRHAFQWFHCVITVSASVRLWSTLMTSANCLTEIAWLWALDLRTLFLHLGGKDNQVNCRAVLSQTEVSHCFLVVHWSFNLFNLHTIVFSFAANLA